MVMPTLRAAIKLGLNPASLALSARFNPKARMTTDVFLNREEKVFSDYNVLYVSMPTPEKFDAFYWAEAKKDKGGTYSVKLLKRDVTGFRQNIEDGIINVNRTTEDITDICEVSNHTELSFEQAIKKLEELEQRLNASYSQSADKVNILKPLHYSRFQ